MKAIRIFLSIFLFFGLNVVSGQITLQPSVSNPSPGTSVTYSVRWPGTCTPGLVNWSWSVTLNGNPISPTSSTKDAVTIYWPYTGLASISYSSVTQSTTTYGYNCGFNSFSSQSASLSVTVDLPPPAKPVILPATLESGSCFIANWQASAGATSYKLDVSSDNFNTYVNGIRDAPVNGTSILIGSLGAGTYQYRVRAFNGTSASPYSDVYSFVVVCSGTPSSHLTNYNIIAGFSDSYCSSGTDIVTDIITGDATIVQSISGRRDGSQPSNNSQPAVVDIVWKQPFVTGYIKVRVDQIRHTYDGWFGCDDGRSTLYYYDLYYVNCSGCATSSGPLTSKIHTSSDYGCGTAFRLFADFGGKNCQPFRYEWNFGDGSSPVILTEPLPAEVLHTYANPGTYNVTLNYQSKCNNSVAIYETTVTRTVNITSVLSSKLDFTSQNTSCGTTFTAAPIHPDNNCTNVLYEWNFGDGAPISTLASPSHLYSRAGTYNVSLKLTYTCNGCQKFIVYNKNVTVPEQTPIASFTQQNNSCTTTFRPVFYLANSGCKKTYTWNFGDGSTYTDTEPLDTQISHTYASAGIYSTTLTVDYYECTSTNCNGQVIITKPTIIVAPDTPAVDFVTQNYACETVFTPTITHTSTSCSTVSYLWNFGDGTTSTESNPSHLYANAGNYNAVLTLTYQCLNTCPAQSSVSVNKTVVLAATPTVTADFTFMNYYCATKFSPAANYGSNTCRSVSYLWNFGDGTTSTERSPLHAYANPGSYNVSFKLVYQCNNGCPAEINVNKQISYTSLPAQFENMLIQVEAEIKNQIITASASTFSDAWPLPHDNASLGNQGNYLNGTLGVWRNNASYAYEVPRLQSSPTNVAQDGTFTLNQFDWGSAKFNVIPNWIQANIMTQYSPYSYELENQDVLGVYSAALYDYGGHLPSANGVNMRHAEMAFTSFEYINVEGNAMEKPSGNWMLSNNPQPATSNYNVPTAIANAAVVEASLEELEFVQRVDVTAETLNYIFPSFFNPYYLPYNKTFNHLQDVEVLCKQVHPTNPKWSIVVLGRAPFEGLWNGKVTVKRSILPNSNPSLYDLAHSGKKSLRVAEPVLTFRQEMLQLEQGKTYWVNVWVSVGNANLPTPKLADNLGIELTFLDKQGNTISTVSFQPVGTVIEGWQQIKGSFVSPINNPLIDLKFKRGSAAVAYYDDLRLQPEKGNMKAYVYDLVDYRLRAILDEENYASFFYYDREGNLYLTKKETEKGIKTITENVSYQVERN